MSPNNYHYCTISTKPLYFDLCLKYKLMFFVLVLLHFWQTSRFAFLVHSAMTIFLLLLLSFGTNLRIFCDICFIEVFTHEVNGLLSCNLRIIKTPLNYDEPI